MSRAIVAGGVFLVCLCGGASGQVQTFPNNYAGFVAAAGPLHTIDFETLPDGSPSLSGVRITSTFNYDGQGVHFSDPLSWLRITGNPTTGYGITTFSESLSQHTWID